MKAYYLRIKLALSIIGIAVLIWGVRADDPVIRWVGIGILAASVLMRLIPRRLRDSDYPETG
jgi:hypothetical protein